MRLSLPKLAILQPMPLYKRLWQGGIALGVILATFAVGNAFIGPDKSVSSRMLGHDFLAFYTAGTFARQGQFDKLYDLDAVRDMEHTIAAQNGLEIGKSFGPYWNPPFYAWMLAPFSAMSYRPALALWTLFNLGCLAAAVVLMIRMLPAAIARPPRLTWMHDGPVPLRFKRDWRIWAAVPLLVCVSMPFIQAISHGQNTFASLLIMAIVVTAWRKRLPVAAGLACGLLFYKPQLAAVVAGMLMLSLGLRVCLGLAFMAGTYMLIMAWTMPDSIGNYLVQLPAILQYMQVENPYLWERHVTLRAFWRLLYQGRGAGEISPAAGMLTMISLGIIGAGLVVAWWRTHTPGIDDCWTGETRSAARDRLIGATIISMPLLMPFYFDYDLLLLAIPAVLLAGEIASRPPGTSLDRMQRMLLGTWIALFAWPIVNPGIAGASGVNVSVVLLATVSGLSIARACQSGLRTTTIKLPLVERVIVKRAA